MTRRRTILAAAALLVALLPCLAQAQGLPAFTATPAPGGGQTYSVSLQTLLALSALSFLPAVLMLTTSFTRIVIVLALLRHALGLQTSPPNQVIVGLAFLLTLFVMGPTFDRIYEQAYKPYAENRMAFNEALARGEVRSRDSCSSRRASPISRCS